jgi:3-hydroxybutyryl-CoA dehydrogenase
MPIREINVIAIIGAGTMGPRIAYRCAVSGLKTLLYDKYPEPLERAMKQIHDWSDKRIQQGHQPAEQTDSARICIRVCSSLKETITEADLVIETIHENLELKRKVLFEINRFLPERAFICTNSSSLPCSRMADVLSRPEKFFNINFSNPHEPADKLVELMRGVDTSEETLIAAEKFVRSLNMVPIVTYNEIMGFSFNRVWRSIKREALHLVDQGFSDYQDIDRAWIMEFGTPYGPFGLMDIIGLDVVRDIEEQYYLDSGEERDKPPKILDDMIKRGKLGVKSGEGFYAYPDPAYKNLSWLHKEGPYYEDMSAKLASKK